MTIEKLFKEIHDALALTDSKLDYDDIQNKLIELCNALNNTDTDESIWYLGEHDSFFTLDSLIVGAYWHFSEWHAGQNSKSHEILCALGSIFSPGMSSLDEMGLELEVYNYLTELAA